MLPSRTSPRRPRSAATDPDCTSAHAHGTFALPLGRLMITFGASPTVTSSLPYPPSLSPKSGSSIRETSKAWDGSTDPVRPFPDLSKL